jgi:hypothetical protein
VNKPISFSVRELLTDSSRYCIPMYQRNYAWGEGEINQLIQDVLDTQKKHSASLQIPPYYIGTLVVFERTDGSFEVIDGQQRFTTLTLLAMCLKRMLGSAEHAIQMGWFNQPNLTFESRPKSIHTFTTLGQGVALNKLQNDEYNQGLLNGFELLEKSLRAMGEQLQAFCEYLFDKVQIIRVSVPKDTDLNHYFEVMNNRGEQLEKHEVLKARLMSVLNTIESKPERESSLKTLTKVWDAAANMERYVQYGFATDERHQIFGGNWDQFNPANYAELSGLLNQNITASEEKIALSSSLSLKDILYSPPKSAQSDSDVQTTERFNSVINFSNFLLHVLRIWTGKDIPLDDKQLIDQFDLHILKSSNPIEQTQEFIFALLKTKYLFDHYIIKREFSEGDDKWSLKRLYYYNIKSQNYINTFDNSEEDGFEGINRRLLLLLSALHVSTPTLVYKHWLNGALNILYRMTTISANEYLIQLEDMARKFVYGRFLCSGTSAEYYEMIYKGGGFQSLDITSQETLGRLTYGAIENNLVFNYLDYLLWCQASEKSDTDEVIKQFEFTFRSSVEHFYPQHPMDGHAELNRSDLDSFGNLCLISHSKNSRLSNFQPKAKRDHFKASIADKSIDSLKLYKMIKLMDDENAWWSNQIQTHEQRMLELLLEDSKKGAHP